jgi:hypothetical protein
MAAKKNDSQILQVFTANKKVLLVAIYNVAAASSRSTNGNARRLCHFYND